MMGEEQTVGDGSERNRVEPIDVPIGCPVVTTTGEVVATVVECRVGSFVIEPREGLLQGYGSWLACPIKGGRTFELDLDAIARLEPSKVVLKAKKPV